MSEKENLIELKLIFIGDEKIGKTTFLLSFFHGKFSLHLDHTLQGVNLFRKELKDYSKLSEYALNVWDIAGNERFYEIFPVLTNSMDGIVLIIEKKINIDTTIESWIAKINKFFTKKTPRFLIALQKDEYFDPTVLMELKNKYQFEQYFILNSSYSIAIKTAFKELCLDIVARKT